jgi:elongation factor Ts
MAKITLEMIKNLRKKTGIGISACKEALEKSDGDSDKAVEYLRKKGILKAKKRADRETLNGHIGSYIHHGQIGVLVELLSETDFVARNEKFIKLAHDIALHIAAAAPLFVSKEDIPQDVLDKEKEIAQDRLKEEGKPEELLDRIAEGQLQKYYEEVCLLEQPFVRDEKKKVKDIIDEAVAAFGEKIEIGRFVRLVLGSEE